jgi:hypothetical protein
MDTRRQKASETAISECRLHLLRAAAEHAEIRLGDSLRDAVFMPGRKHWADLGLPIPQKPATEWTTQQVQASPSYEVQQERLIEQWSADNNLNYDWVHDAARQALAFEVFPERPFGYFPMFMPPRFLWPSWCFELESPVAYRNSCMARFEEVLDSYIRAVKTERRRFLSHRQSQNEHYEWAAERVCLLRGWSDIAKKHPVRVSWQAVRKAVLPILNRVGIPLMDLEAISRSMKATKYNLQHRKTTPF